MACYSRGWLHEVQLLLVFQPVGVAGSLRLSLTSLCDLADPSDRSWIYDQVMEIEVPQALLTVNKALDDLYGPAPV